MTAIDLLVTLAIAGFLVWIILQVPMPGIFRNIIIGVASIILILLVLQFFGIHTGFTTLRIIHK